MSDDKAGVFIIQRPRLACVDAETSLLAYDGARRPAPKSMPFAEDVKAAEYIK